MNGYWHVPFCTVHNCDNCGKPPWDCNCPSCRRCGDTWGPLTMGLCSECYDAKLESDEARNAK